MKQNAELKKTHDAMARYLIYLCRFSDKEWKGGYRGDICEKHYQKARQLIEQAGFKYSHETVRR